MYKRQQPGRLLRGQGAVGGVVDFDFAEQPLRPAVARQGVALDDQIEANYVEAVAVSLEPAKKGAKK